MDRTFFAAISRMKYIERWALMRNSRGESLCEHSMEVAVIAHALCVIGNVRYGRHLNAEHAAVLGLYHDAPEIITGDMPTPVKYGCDELRDAYRHVEHVSARQLLSHLPDDLRPVYEELVDPQESAAVKAAGGDCPGGRDAAAGASDVPFDREYYTARLVKAADKLSALIKCMEEEKAGNTEFKSAQASTREKIRQLAEELPEVRDFAEEFLPSYGRTLDELL